nr:hypothetical protein [Pantoea ananatis]
MNSSRFMAPQRFLYTQEHVQSSAWCPLTGLPVAGFVFALIAAGSSISGTGWLRVGCVMLVLIMLSATGFVQALATSFRLWQLSEKRVTASENGSFQAYLQETRWCRQVLSGGLF